MTELSLIEITAPFVRKDLGLYSLSEFGEEGGYLSWMPNDSCACLDGRFTADELLAVAIYMKGTTQGIADAEGPETKLDQARRLLRERK